MIKLANNKFKKTIIIIIGAIIITVILVILFISPITKYLIEKYSEKYTGRQIKIGWVYLNPFTGYVHFSKIKIYESKNINVSHFVNVKHLNSDSNDIFFSADGISVSVALRKLFSKTIEISEITFDHPKGIIIQKNRMFNITDLIIKFTPDTSRLILKSQFSNLKFNVLKIHIIEGEFHYNEQTIPIHYFIKNVNIESSGKKWNVDTIGARFSFLSGTGTGNVKGDFTINFANLDYHFATLVDKFGSKLTEEYLKALINYGSFSGNLDADVKATGNLSDEENINLKGWVAINDFHLGKYPGDDYASFDELLLQIDELCPKDHKYLFNSLLLNKPYFKYEKYDYLDNLEMMFGKNGSNIAAANADPAKFNLIIQIADYVKILAKNFFQSDYKINKLNINNGGFRYNDYSLSEQFSIEAIPLNVSADSINSKHKRVSVSFNSGIQPFGNASVYLSINPKDSGDFDMQYKIHGVPVSVFNPILINYTSYPLDMGTIEMTGKWYVRNSIIKSENNLLVIDPRLSKRLKNKNDKWLPMPLIMAFIRENGNVIDYQIPISGNLKNPKFHLHDVLTDIFKNIFVKPPTTPYRMEVRNTEKKIEKSLSLTWNFSQTELLHDQKKFVNKMADFLKNNPDASISVYPINYEDNEKEYIEFFEAKKKFFLSTKKQESKYNNDQQSTINYQLTKRDSLEILKMSVKDSGFIKYLNKQLKISSLSTKNYALSADLLFTIQAKCIKLVGSAIINVKFNQLNKKRKEAFIRLFTNKLPQALTNGSLKIYNGENTIPFNGFSFYKIVYKGENPESLTRAFQVMNEFNNGSARRMFKKEREKIRNKL